jgi:hypothetical protein
MDVCKNKTLSGCKATNDSVWTPLISGIRITEREFYSRSHDAVIRVYDEAGNVIETHEHAGDFKEL